MRITIAWKWTSRVKTSFTSKAIIEKNCTHYQPVNCRGLHRFSEKLTYNETSSKSFININRRNLMTTSIFLKSKDKEKNKKPVKYVDLNELGQVINVERLTSNFDKSLTDLRANFMKNLTLRSTTGSIESLNVNFEGDDYILQELVEISRKPKTVVLNVSSFPQAIPQVLDALNKSGMNLNPQQDGTTIFIPIPKVTKEHRENLSKNAKVLYIKCRDSIKDIRSKELRDLKKIPSLSEDTIRRIQAQIEALTEQYIKEAEKILETKQKELVGSSD